MLSSSATITGTAADNTLLAAALTALGIPLAEKPFVTLIESATGRERTHWFFDDASPCGRFVTKDMVEAWHNDAWHHANPEHPFAYIKCALLNRERLVDKVKQCAPIVAIRRKGKVVFLPVDTPQREQDVFLKLL